MRNRFKTKSIFERISLASRIRTASSKGTRRKKFRRQLAIESLEERRLLANVGINLRVDIQQFVPNAYTDPLNGDGDFYAVVESFRGGPIFNTSNNPLTGSQNFGIGAVDPSPWSGNVAYSISDEALLY